MGLSPIEDMTAFSGTVPVDAALALPPQPQGSGERASRGHGRGIGAAVAGETTKVAVLLQVRSRVSLAVDAGRVGCLGA